MTNEIVGCPLFSSMFYCYFAKGYAKGRRLISLFSDGSKAAKTPLAPAIGREGKNLILDAFFGAESEFSVTRNLLEKAFAYPRGSVSVE